MLKISRVIRVFGVFTFEFEPNIERRKWLIVFEVQMTISPRSDTIQNGKVPLSWNILRMVNDLCRKCVFVFWHKSRRLYFLARLSSSWLLATTRGGSLGKTFPSYYSLVAGANSYIEALFFTVERFIMSLCHFSSHWPLFCFFSFQSMLRKEVLRQPKRNTFGSSRYW